MKLVVKREPFLNALDAASAVVPLRSVRPNLKNALLVASKDGDLEIRATDLEVGLRYKLKAESVKDAASLCLPCGTLAGLLKECTEDVVTLETEGSKGILKIGRDRFEILGQESSDFPEVPDLGEGPSVSVPAADLGQMIDRTIFAAAREQGRYAINGVFVLYKDKLLELVATDGRRLAYCKRKLKAGGGIDEGVIVPIKMMQEIRKLCGRLPDGENVELAVRGRSVLVRGGKEDSKTTLSSLVVEGIFPKYQQVIPKDSDREATFKREAVLQALRKAAYLTSDDTRTVSLTFTPGTLLIEARSPDKGVAAVTVEVEFAGDKVSIAFNPQYVQDALKVLNEETLRFEMKDGARPGVVREGSDFLYVLMPVSAKD
ncbi:MAG: DNA polymerase III subunit beta [Planctomycetes bacterium]|nr:DNA polymerase III subunit beta [Planctomycetota bacterium]